MAHALRCNSAKVDRHHATGLQDLGNASGSMSPGRMAQELARLISEHQLEVRCFGCASCMSKPLGFIKANREMRCPECSAIIRLDISLVRGEVRRIEKSMRALHSQLSAVIGER